MDLPPWIQKYVLDEDVQHNMYEFAKRLYNTEKKMKEEQSLGRLRPALLNDRKRSLLQVVPPPQKLSFRIWARAVEGQPTEFGANCWIFVTILSFFSQW